MSTRFSNTIYLISIVSNAQNRNPHIGPSTASSVANVQAAIEHIFPLVYEFRKKRTVLEATTIDNNLMKEIASDLDNFESGNEPKRKKYPFGLENEPDDDIMCVSDVEDDD